MPERRRPNHHRKRRPAARARAESAPARRPWRRLAVWALCITALALLGTGLAERLAPTTILVPGTPAARAHEVVEREFGSSVPVTVLLEGPADELDRQGPGLIAALRDREAAQIMSPWGPRAADPELLRPRPDAALIVADFRASEGDAMNVVVPTVQRLVDERIHEPARAHVGGIAAIARALQQNALSATHKAELIAAPILLVVLLLVFRTPVAAALPLLIGATTVLAGRGLLYLTTFVLPINALAVSMASMMGLALGVDYALLMVSRYRQEREAGAAAHEAVATAARAAGRTIIFAGTTLGLAMITAAIVAPGDLLTSVAAGVAISTAVSVLLGISLLPGLIRALAPFLDRWQLPRLRRGPGLTDAAQRLVARPWIAIPAIALPLAALALPAHALEIGSPDPRQLPADDPTRQGFEALRRTIGPGWSAPIAVTATAERGPITAPGRLEAIARWQRRVARDPAVAAVIGPARLLPAQRQLERARAQYRRAPQRLARAERGLERLQSGLGAAATAVEELRAGLGEASSGAATIAAHTREAQAGAQRLERGLERALAGGRRLERGLERARLASGRLASGQRRLGRGSERLARGLRRLDRTLTVSLARLEGPMRELERWAEWLRSLREPARRLADELDRALEALDRLPLDPDDPRQRELREALERAAALAGVELPGPPPVDLRGVRSLTEALDRIESELGAQLATLERLPRELDALASGVRRLREGGDRLAAGSRRALDGAGELEAGLESLSAGGERLAEGLAAGPPGARRLGAGLGELATGGERLAGELGRGRERSGALVEGLARPRRPLDRFAIVLGGYRDSLGQLERRSPRALESGYLLLSVLDGTAPGLREQLGRMINLDRGGRSVRMLVIPAAGPGSERTRGLSDRLLAALPELERSSGTTAEVGEGAQALRDYTGASLERLPWLVLALCAVSVLMLVAILRSLLLPIAAVALNLLTIGAAFGALKLLFELDLLVGPAFIDAISAAGVLTVMFVLAIDYEVFLLSRIREIWLRTGDHARAIREGLRHTAGVITGAAVIMSSVFLAFATADIASLQQFGAGLTIAVALDATVVRLVLLPAIMRALGPRAWWLPAWLDRRLPVLDHGDGPAPRTADGRSARATVARGADASALARREPSPGSRGRDLDLQQDDRVEDEDDREEDRPAVQVSLDQRAAPEGASRLADPERAREPRVLPRVQEHKEDQDDRDEDLEQLQDDFHGPGSVDGARPLSR